MNSRTPGVHPTHYATYFDRHYLTRGLALLRSLEQHCAPFVLWVLCLDAETEELLRRLDSQHVRRVPLAELEQADPALLAVKPNRQPVEYFWTCGPALLVHVLRRDPTIETLAYLDADMFFFDAPAPIFAGLRDRSIVLMEQRYVQAKGGRFNVGMLAFRRTPSALACLNRWREQCLEWCYDRFEPGRHGDQKYLEEWPDRYDVTILEYAGAGVAPWNVETQRIHYRGGRVLVEGDPLVVYHFARIHLIHRWIYELHDYRWQDRKMDPLVRRWIYAPYIRELYAAEGRVRQLGGRVYKGTARQPDSPGEAVRRKRAQAVPWTRLAQYQRFMFVAGRWTW